MKYYLQHIRSILFALVFLTVSGTVLWFQSDRITRNGNDLQEKLQAVANDDQFDQEYESLVEMLETTESEREKLAEFILDDEHDIIRLLTKIDNFAASQGVELSTSKLNTKEIKGDFDELMATFEVKGAEYAVIQTIKTLESLPYHSEVKSLQFRRGDNNGTSGFQEVTATISLALSIQKI